MRSLFRDVSLLSIANLPSRQRACSSSLLLIVIPPIYRPFGSPEFEVIKARPTNYERPEGTVYLRYAMRLIARDCSYRESAMVASAQTRHSWNNPALLHIATRQNECSEPA